MATKTWNGSNADWYANSGANWNPAGDPAATDDVAIDSGTSPTVSGAVRVHESDMLTGHGTTPSASANAPFSGAVATVSDTGYVISSRSVA
jgi:hypothetical protein